jgi:hypothetical protein
MESSLPDALGADWGQEKKPLTFFTVHKSSLNINM